ncbi:hypothetical protein [Polyangium jinanense]|uniref:Uncharacterized protein n=1 Tax=Polyangium jinanense TaxID=2829994 RepID=A0A9X4AV77_9BACT|nr:hypothetical protein [Polyangium jinanense]MDC3958915.1 hypothetical protein [Polyangium jinanense]MDC3986029.1 hypothetical protein [Polyangium jinanense]
MSIGESRSPDGNITATLSIPRGVLQLVAPPPETLSQCNVEAVTGIPRRVFLEAIRAPDFPVPVARLGKLRIVNRVAFVAWLEENARKQSATPSSPSATNDAAPTDDTAPAEHADDILGAVGLQPRPASPSRARATNRRARRV